MVHTSATNLVFDQDISIITSIRSSITMAAMELKPEQQLAVEFEVEMMTDMYNRWR